MLKIVVNKGTLKRITTYLFLGFMLFNFSSVMLFLKLMQWQAKYEMSQKMLFEQPTEHFVFHKNTFRQRLKRGSEFEIQDKRYDIVFVKYEADSVHIEAVNDIREKGIIHYIGKLLHAENKNSNTAPKIRNTFFSNFNAPLPQEVVITPHVKVTQEQSFPIICSPLDVYTPVKTPPPRYIV
jgi:hypothetical protein